MFNCLPKCTKKTTTKQTHVNIAQKRMETFCLGKKNSDSFTSLVAENSLNLYSRIRTLDIKNNILVDNNSEASG